MVLTPREQELLSVIQTNERARSAKSIARLMDISTRASEASIAAICKKLPPAFETNTKPMLRVLLWALIPRA